MKYLAMVFVMLACATWSGVHKLAAGDHACMAPAPVGAEAIPPLQAPSPLVRDAEIRNVEDTTPKRPLAGRGSAEGESRDQVVRDPTRPSPIMRQLIAPAKLPGQAKAPEIPVVELKARVINAKRPGVVVLDIDKQTYVVCKGSEFNLAGPKYVGQKIRVVELDADAVTLEIQPANLTVTLR